MSLKISIHNGREQKAGGIWMKFATLMYAYGLVKWLTSLGVSDYLQEHDLLCIEYSYYCRGERNRDELMLKSIANKNGYRPDCSVLWSGAKLVPAISICKTTTSSVVLSGPIGIMREAKMFQARRRLAVVVQQLAAAIAYYDIRRGKQECEEKA